MILELPITLKDRELDELGIEHDTEKSTVLIRSDRIESAYPSHDLKTDEECTSVFMCSGDNYLIYMRYEEFKAIWFGAIAETIEK